MSKTIAGFSRIGIVGGGQMGAGIAQVMATTGLNTMLVDINPAQIETAKTGIHTSLEKLAAKNIITADAKTLALSGLNYSIDLEALKDCDLVIEAIVENENLQLFWQATPHRFLSRA